MDYVYDLGGNRIVKIDNIANRRVIYTYDISAPTTYNSDNNRLMYYETYDTSVTPWVPLSTTWTSYNTQGNATRVVTEPASPTLPVQATRFVYNHSQQVSYIVGEQWYRGNGDCNTYTISYAREFRYDAARARYLNRELDPALFRQGQYVSLGDTWSDYDGDSIYGDFSVTAGSPPTVTNLRSFEPGLAQQDPAGQSSGTKYAHSDHVGTLRTQTDSSGSALSTTTYTAFGERIDGGAVQRYGYAGAWGYQTHDFPSGESVEPIPFMHVGWRYYDPGTGRFLQRDPIGIDGGSNVYGYSANSPTQLVDPYGLTVSDKPPKKKKVVKKKKKVVINNPPPSDDGGTVGVNLGPVYVEGKSPFWIKWLKIGCVIPMIPYAVVDVPCGAFVSVERTASMRRRVASA